MKQIYRYSNFLLLIFSAIICYITFDGSKISADVLDLFPKVEQRDLLDVHKNLESSNQMLVYTQDSAEVFEKITGVLQVESLKDNIYMLNIDKNIALEDFYNDFKSIAEKIDDIKYFSSDILRIENTEAIFSDVNVIMASSITFLVILYLFILRIPFLSLNTLLTIVSANLLGISLITTLYDNVNIMSLEFGVAIGNLAIDYMLHHHFFRLYMHQFKFNKSVFYGFITTFIGFGVCLLIPFPLLSQLSVYALVCLLVSYVSFGFIYQAIGFKKPIFFKNLRRLRKPKINNLVILFIAIVIFAITLPNLSLDYDLERLDYENKLRIADREFFLDTLGKTESILIMGESREDVENKAFEVASNLPLENIKTDIRNLNIIEHNGTFYTKINSTSIENLKNFDYIDTRSIKELSDEIISGIYAPMLKILAIVIAVMVCIVFAVTRSLISFSYTIVPLSVISLFFLSTDINIMHLFSLLIVVVASVDYGIYVEKEGENIRTLHAIIFSALTTIAGFGFLSFSDILALKSFGMTISIGLIVILALLLFQKRHIKKSRSIRVTNN